MYNFKVFLSTTAQNYLLFRHYTYGVKGIEFKHLKFAIFVYEQ